LEGKKQIELLAFIVFLIKYDRAAIHERLLQFEGAFSFYLNPFVKSVTFE
jgi:hypothetical protein